MPTGTARIFYILGLLLMAACILDIALARFDILKGPTWTPIALGGAGIILMQLARFMQMTTRSRSDDDEVDGDRDQDS